jgi:uncharacterized protein
MSETAFTNRLIHETSPYLLQHAHNPVNWYPWCDEALQKAKQENKPILVSIGYSACHWCHVMEKESFEDEPTAAIMNAHFINIKRDREERPDLDHIYMDAVQVMTGSGGWPLNVFLTTDARPFYGGTYFPPVQAYNRMSWKDTLLAVHKTYTEKKNEIEAQADNLIAHIENANSFGIQRSWEKQETTVFTQENLETITKNLLLIADTDWGGFGKAPKFPQTFSIQFLLRQHHFTGNAAALQQALLSLDKMAQGGIYDHLGGGFARYSTDDQWLAPHFEKMLYDNALLLNVYSEAFQLTRNDNYATIIEETVGFIKEELVIAEGGICSALDADSEGVEGKFYVWNKAEIEAILGEDAAVFCAVYHISDKGNWEHVNILWLPATIAQMAKALNMEVNALQQLLQLCKAKLLAVRKKRIKPLLDDKILLGWNALSITGLCKAYAATGNHSYLEMAKQNMVFLEKYFIDKEGNWYHTWKGGLAKYPAFLDDYAYLIQAYIHLQEVTGNADYLIKAKLETERALHLFGDTESPFFWFTKSDQDDVVVRKKEIYDGAVPSGNAVMAQNLYYLSVVFNNAQWRKRTEDMIESLGTAIVRHPNSFGIWAMQMQQIVVGLKEIVVCGADIEPTLQQVNALYIPAKVLQSMDRDMDDFPLLAGKNINEGRVEIYLCEQYSCKKPVFSAKELNLLLKN